jgi:hypothetical protein
MGKRRELGPAGYAIKLPMCCERPYRRRQKVTEFSNKVVERRSAMSSDATPSLLRSNCIELTLSKHPGPGAGPEHSEERHLSRRGFRRKGRGANPCCVALKSAPASIVLLLRLAHASVPSTHRRPQLPTARHPPSDVALRDLAELY